MNVQKFVAGLLEEISSAAGRPICAAVCGAPAEAFFAELPPEEDQDALHRAAQIIGGYLAVGEGEIPASQIAKAIDLYHSQSGTGWCPPLIAALDGL